jgi:hypothetical protein
VTFCSMTAGASDSRTSRDRGTRHPRNRRAAWPRGRGGRRTRTGRRPPPTAPVCRSAPTPPPAPRPSPRLGGGRTSPQLERREAFRSAQAADHSSAGGAQEGRVSPAVTEARENHRYRYRSRGPPDPLVVASRGGCSHRIGRHRASVAHGADGWTAGPWGSGVGTYTGPGSLSARREGVHPCAPTQPLPNRSALPGVARQRTARRTPWPGNPRPARPRLVPRRSRRALAQAPAARPPVRPALHQLARHATTRAHARRGSRRSRRCSAAVSAARCS